MTTSASSPVALSPQTQDLSDKLDEDIERVRAEIQSLTKRKNILVSSILSSTKIQPLLSAHNDSNPNTTLPNPTQLQFQIQHNQTNIHRLAFGVTAFPFTDPNPDTSDRPLLGVRFDIPGRSRRFKNAPYYIFLKRAHDDTPTPFDTANSANLPPTSSQDILKIHHHTIPAFVPLEDYEARYLPKTTDDQSNDIQRRDEGYFSPSSPSETNPNDIMQEDPPTDPNNQTNNPRSRQDLHTLVAVVRHDLVSWQLRNEAILLLAEQLNLSDTEETDSERTAKFSLLSLQATAADARFCRLVWQNGTVGRLRLTDDGYVDRAVVIGEVGDEGRTDRLKNLERLLCTGADGGRLSVDKLVQRLEKVAARMNERVARQDTEDQDDNDGMTLDATNNETQI